MAKSSEVAVGSVGRVLSSRPDRVAAAWRRVRHSQVPRGTIPDNLLDTLVEPFIKELGDSLCGVSGSAWSRTRGVLKVSSGRGERRLYEEFAALRRCLVDAVEVLGGSTAERAKIESSVDEALDSAITLCRRFSNPDYDAPHVPFGGLVVEFFESKPALLRSEAERAADDLH